ncbi:four helix bundle protein [Patescibacteria group bacterium]|jgi:four helix bundle protein|nr:four helix bundle protein [Patescibacteria group bacterium]
MPNDGVRAQQGRYDLEERTKACAKEVRVFVKKLPTSMSTVEDSKQLIRSSGSVGANYIEANEALGKNDFRMHIKIAKKEAKESMYWLELLDVGQDTELQQTRTLLRDESRQLMLILGSVLHKRS